MLGKTILILDDDSIGRDFFSSLLPNTFRVLHASSQTEANEIFKNELFIDVIFADYNLPDIDGLSILEKIANDHPYTIRILLTTPQKDNLEKKEYIPGYFHYVINKPYNRESVNKIIGELFSTEFFDDEYAMFHNRLKVLQDILRDQNIKNFFQPIVQFEPYSVIGHEVFTRGPSRSILEGSRPLIKMAQQGGLISDLEQIALKKAGESIKNFHNLKKFFINCFPSFLSNINFNILLASKFLNLKPHNIVIEIIQSNTINDINAFTSQVNFLREIGYQFSIDDAGLDYSSLYLIDKINPDYVKINESFIRDIHLDSNKRQFVRNFVRYAEKWPIKIIAECVETNEELDSLKKLGITMGQGFLFSKPHPFLTGLTENSV